ncbi:hypothetical protein [Mycobacterium sp. 29Ha]|uniref:hypothetical protein n=1 Tax=Mycobacterium sp. 29Ha TaxID=2939268 RepID=UPI002938E83C|nr:hypothetical protein [Mycobacterium sp. 29Ha]MDV3131990.1 hypothetical protein [Mycobacterium sp. 29Ha]
MLTTNYGALVPEDELLTHQIVDTFATVSQSDPSWTEKIWTIAHARDNSLQVVLGVGKYTNRGVFDGAAGVCRGTEQWTVRAGRRLSSDPAGTQVGPIAYRVVEPLRAVRVSLERTEHAPIAFDVELRGTFDTALEDPWPDRSPDGYRVTHNVLRYHQIGVASGWVELDGERTEIEADKWISIRDHSWGLRPGVGKPIPGLPRGGRKIKQMFMTWLPMTMTRRTGRRTRCSSCIRRSAAMVFSRSVVRQSNRATTGHRTGSCPSNRTCTFRMTTAASPTAQSPSSMPTGPSVR